MLPNRTGKRERERERRQQGYTRDHLFLSGETMKAWVLYNRNSKGSVIHAWPFPIWHVKD